MKKDSKKKNREIARLINGLTKDEDLRQELWVQHLEGAEFSQLFNMAKRNITPIETLPHKIAIQAIIDNPPPDSFLNNFNNTQLQIMCLLAIGYNVGDVCVLLGMSEVSIKRIIVNIGLNEAWKTKWHSKEILQMKKSLV